MQDNNNNNNNNNNKSLVDLGRWYMAAYDTVRSDFFCVFNRRFVGDWNPAVLLSASPESYLFSR